MDSVYETSVLAIETLQQRFQQQRDIFFMISNVFDPRYAFLLYSPLIFALDRNIGKKVMWVSIIAEWSNQVLKWMLHGERPYWWVHETPLYNQTGVNMPAIQQYFLTCETGPGSPSGHAMVSAALWYVIFESFLKKSSFLNQPSKNMLSSICWFTYMMILLTVSLSRIYIAAHFPHQCLLGMVIGCGVAMMMQRVNIDTLRMRHYFLATVMLMTSAMSTYVVLKALGMNPMWSVDRAVRWCAKQEYIHLDTTPFFSMMRYSGFTLGMGLGLSSNFFKQASNIHFSTYMKVITAILAITVTKCSEQIVLPKSNMIVFYSLAFVMNAILPYLTIAVVPFIIYKGYLLMNGQKQKST